jgi:3-dehydroquinate synthase
VRGSSPAGEDPWREAFEGVEAGHYVIDRAALRASAALRRSLNSMKCAVPARSETVVGGAERTKSLTTFRRMIDWFDQNKVARRSEPVIVIGGGALLDMVSFAASTYRRGVPVVKVPTTLIGIVDAAVAAKTALNFQGRKNLVGSFYPPQLVVLDPAFLTSLPMRHVSSGIAEILKVGLACDAALVDDLDNGIESLIRTRFRSEQGVHVLTRALDLLIETVWADPWEAELSRVLDLGHSLSKVFEETLCPRPTHGEAVALDMAIACAVGVQKGRLSLDDLARITTLMSRSGLDVDHAGIDRELLRRGCDDTTVHRDASTLSPIVGPVGEVSFLPVCLEQLLSAQGMLRSLAG